MNDNFTTTESGINDNALTAAEFKLVPVKLTDEELQKLLEAKPLDGQVTYVTDADETADEPTPTIH